MKYRVDTRWFTRLIVPQASQLAFYRRAKFGILLAVPPTHSVCGKEFIMKNMKKTMAVMLAFTIILSVFQTSTVNAAGKKKIVKSMSVSKSSVSVKAGKSVTVSTTVKCRKTSAASDMRVKVKSSNTKVATVKVAANPSRKGKNGKSSIKITGKSAGSANITVTTVSSNAKGKSISKVIKVKVSKKTTSNVVKWTVKEEKFMGAYSYKDETTNEDLIIPKELTRKYVSFNPWPTTNEQVQYVIKNCDDPFVVGALYVVALDNYEYKGLSDYSSVAYNMLNSLMNGAGTVTGPAYELSLPQKQKLRDYGMKQILTISGTAVNVTSFASRAYLKGATPYNNYTPDGGVKDKTKWQIVMDEYVYCGDLANGYITVCPQRYSESQETAGGDKEVIEHWQGMRIGFRWDKTAKVWLPTDNVKLNNPPSGPLVPFDITKQIMFSNNYIAPV